MHGARAEVSREARLAEVEAQLTEQAAAILRARPGVTDPVLPMLARRFVVAVQVLDGFERELVAAGVVTATRRARRLVPHYQAQLTVVLRLAGVLLDGRAEDGPPADALAHVRAAVEAANRDAS